jgi:hypothetical protein
MSDEPPVVPIREGATIEVPRARQLLEYVAEQLAAFPGANQGEEPQDIAFVIVGEKGTARTRYLVRERWRSVASFAGNCLLHAAMNDD